MIKEIAFTDYPAKGVAALRRWYEEKLELRDVRLVQDGTENYAQAKVSEGYFSVSTFEWIGLNPGSSLPTVATMRTSVFLDTRGRSR